MKTVFEKLAAGLYPSGKPVVAGAERPRAAGKVRPFETLTEKLARLLYPKTDGPKERGP